MDVSLVHPDGRLIQRIPETGEALYRLLQDAWVSGDGYVFQGVEYRVLALKRSADAQQVRVVLQWLRAC